MPPPRREARSAKAGEIFVDRDDPKRIFETAAFAIPPDRSVIRVFYGAGGQGKTALCRELFRATSAEAEPSYGFLRRALLDLHGKVKTDPDLLVVWIRNEFAKAGVAFPAFDLALALAWGGSRGEQPFPKLDNPWLAKSADALVDVAPDAVQTLREAVEKTVETIPGLGVLITKGSKWVIDRTKRAYLERTRGVLKELYRDGELKPPYELSELLPWMLAQDLNFHLSKNPTDRFVLFIDEYERVFEEGGAGARWRENLFDRHMRTFIQESSGLLAIFCSREMLPWDKDPDWHADLQGAQHLLGGIEQADADEWLRRVPVDDSDIRKAIIDGSREEPKDGAPIYPLMLDLQISHWRALSAGAGGMVPEQFHVTADTFQGRCQELVEQVLRDYGDELQVTLERLSVASRFDRAAFEHVVSTFGTGLPFDSFERIAKLSFVTESEDGFLTMHTAVADAIRTTLDEERLRNSAEALLEHYETRATVSSPLNVTDATIAALIEAAYLRRVIGIDGYVDWLAGVIAPVQIAARYAAAERLWREALDLIEGEFGTDHVDSADGYNAVAFCLFAQGRYAEAEPLFRIALGIRERALGLEHPETASSYNNIAVNLDAQGRYAEAEPLIRKALEINKRALGEEHPITATSYNKAAVNLNARGHHEQAEPFFRNVLDIRERVLGEEHPDTAASYNNVASNLDAQGRHQEAEPLYRKALDIKERVLGAEHPDTASSYNNIATNLMVQGRHEEAEPLMRKALHIKEQALGAEHPDTATGYNNLALTINSQGRHEEAEPLYRKALEIRKQVLGTEHPNTEQSYSNLASNAASQGRLEEAEQLYKVALDISERVRGAEHPRTILIRSNLLKLARK